MKYTLEDLKRIVRALVNFVRPGEMSARDRAIVESVCSASVYPEAAALERAAVFLNREVES